MNLPKNVNDMIPAGLLNNIIPGAGRGGGLSSLNIPKNPLDAVNDMLPTGMLNNIIPGGTGGAISITLDSPNNCYYAGTVVSGKVIVQMEKPENIRALSLKVKGGANVTWTETGTETVQQTGAQEGAARQEQSVTLTYTSEEEYFSNKFNLLGETQLPAGTQSYMFSSPLPPLLPSSFTGENGNIKYTVVATMDRAWKFDQSAEVEFKVVTPMDLNHNAVAKEPAKKEVSKHFCCLFCQSGPLTLAAALPYTGYVAGQAVNVAVEVDNASNVQIDDVLIKIDKTITWICQRPERKERQTHSEIAKVTMEGVNAHGSKSWSQQLVLPTNLSSTNIDACSLIKMKHVLRVLAEVSGCHQNLELEIPLIIGTIPIQGIGGVNPMFPGGDSAIPSYPASNVGPTVPSNPTMDINQGYPYPGGNPAASNQYPGQPAYPSAPSAPPESPSASPTQPLLYPGDIGFNLPVSPPPPYPA